MRRKKSPKSNGHGAFSSIIQEEEEGEEEDYDDLDDMYTDPDGYSDHGPQKEASVSGISYQYQPPFEQHPPASRPVPKVASSTLTSFKEASHSHDRPAAAGLPVLPDPDASRTFNFATGRMTAVFELPHPQRLAAEPLLWSHGAGLQHAQRAFYGKLRPARERIHWAFNPQKDPRVGSLMQWIGAMSDRLAMLGVSPMTPSRVTQ